MFWPSRENRFVTVTGARSCVKSRARRACLPPSAFQSTTRFLALYSGGEAGSCGEADRDSVPVLTGEPVSGGEAEDEVYGGGARFSRPISCDIKHESAVHNATLCFGFR